MASISKLSNAIVSIPNELTVAAANFNLDFSLMKVEAPKEYHGLRDVLSSHRRNAAEEGQPHITARRLGSLFDSILPPIPNLIQAYGKRVSEISHSKATQKPPSLGMFTAHSGPDGTNIWAAATSGQSAIAVHLLACMLARIWKKHEAISLWVELVERRKEEIKLEYQNTNVAETASIMAAHQSFDRQQLAGWDASARAWLQTADSNRQLQQTQLMLIINNVQIPVSTKKNVYENIMEAWRLGMMAMERLVQGIPQQVQNGSVLLAISAWHLYPNMEVLSEQASHIVQQDSLMNGALLTIPEATSDSEAEGIFWSLPLARMRYYAPPVEVSRRLASDTSRVPMKDFWIIILGTFFAQWRSVIKDMATCCKFIIDTYGFVTQADTDTCLWLGFLAEAAKRYTAAEGIYRRQCDKLLRLGIKQCKSLLNAPGVMAETLFGLSRFEVLLGLITSVEDRIAVLRKISLSLETPGNDSTSLLLRYPSPTTVRAKFGSDCPQHYRYVSAIPRVRDSSFDRVDGEPIVKRKRYNSSEGHFRWIVDRRDFDDVPSITCDGNTCGCTTPDGQDCPCAEENQECSEYCHGNYWMCPSVLSGLQKPCPSFCSDGAECSTCSIRHELEVIESLGEDHILVRAKFINTIREHQFRFDGISNGTTFEFVLGDLKDVALFKATDMPINRDFNGSSGSAASLEEIQEILSLIRPEKLVRYLETWWSQDILGSGQQHETSMRALVFATKIYEQLDQAMISIETIKKPLYEQSWAKWAYDTFGNKTRYKRDQHNWSWPPERLDTEEQGNRISITATTTDYDWNFAAASFACIAALESGECDLNLKSLKGVLALSIGDSIFVLSALISDPTKSIDGNAIRRVFGNLGRPEMAFIVPPSKPRLNGYDLKSWHLIEHIPFDGKFESGFGATSLHFSFTDFQMPIDVGSRGLRDTQVVLLEALISIYDRGKHLGEIDVLSLFHSNNLTIIPGCKHTSQEVENTNQASVLDRFEDLISIDSWDEFFDFPDPAGIVRVNGNWQARLAITAVSTTENRRTIILPEDPCLRCLEESCAKGPHEVICIVA